jgi:hypothetical protein
MSLARSWVRALRVLGICLALVFTLTPPESAFAHVDGIALLDGAAERSVR